MTQLKEVKEVKEAKKESGALKVKVAYLHAAIMFGGKTESTLSKGKFKDIQMEYSPAGLKLSMSPFDDQIIPSANIKNVVLFKG